MKRLERLVLGVYYTVAEIAERLNLSKQGVYNKLKLKEIKLHTSKKQGTTYIDDIGLKLIEDSINDFVAVEPAPEETTENKPFEEELKDVESSGIAENDFINYLKEENSRLWEQVNTLNRLIENGQVLLKDKSQDDTELLEGHCSEVDGKLTEVKERMTERKESGQRLFGRWFGSRK